MSCQHCASTELEAFSPLSHAATHGAVLLCRRCRRVTVALPSRLRRSPALPQTQPQPQTTTLPTAA